MSSSQRCAKLAHMGGVTYAELGERIRAARERAGHSQGDLAAMVGLDRTAVNKIEAGTRKVTAVELSDIATALSVRMATFFADPVPAIVSHRARQGADTTDATIDRTLARLGDDIELVDRLAPGVMELDGLTERAGATQLSAPESMKAADELARAARRLLDLDDVEPVKELVDAAASIGLLIFSTDLGPDTADAGTVLLRRGGVSVVNSHNRVGRRRLAAAHELGHYLAADDYTIDWKITGHREDTEARLDRFARAFLLPTDGITEAWSAAKGDFDLRTRAVLAGSRYRVDMSTLIQRLLDLGLATSSDADELRDVTTTRADIVEHGLVIPADLEGTSQPAPFQRAVLQAVRTERISRERALDLLQGTFSDADLPDPRPRQENEIWDYVS